MNLITKQELANKARDRWKAQYCNQGIWNYDETKKSVYQKLESLGDTPSSDNVNKAIGNNSWTRLNCSECGENVDVAVILGSIDYDSEYVYACKDCLTKALDLF